MVNIVKPEMPKAIVGLGNPGPKFKNTRHNIGFRILDNLADKYSCSWPLKNNLEYCEININNNNIILVKPLTFMNNSGQVMKFLTNKNIKPEEILVIHDELEMSFGKISFKYGGSARGHNGLKSIISYIGPDFYRLRFGIGRPENRQEVPDYVLSNFSEDKDLVEEKIEEAVSKIESLY